MSAAVQDATRLQRLASDPSRHVAVTANAGSGKTRVLVDRVIRLLLAGADPAKILCVTYTKAAASEMQSRLFARLSAWSTRTDDVLAREIAEMGAETPSAGLSTARALFARALETPGGLKIQTIHAFCERVLRRFPVEAGIEPGFAILDDGEARALSEAARAHVAQRANAGDAALASAFAGVAGVVLDDKAIDGLFDWAGGEARAVRAFVDACGDADGLRRRVFADYGAPPDTDGETLRAEAWRDAPHTQLGILVDAMQAGSSSDHKLAQKISAALATDDPVRAFGRYRSVFFTEKNAPRKTLATNAALSAHPIVGALLGTEKAGWGSEAARMHRVDALAQRADAARFAFAALTLADAYARAFIAQKERAGGLDFSDLIAATGRLLSDAEASAWVLYKLDAGVDHVLVDEAQDTSPDQWRVVHQLTDEFFAGEGAREVARTVFFVGDEKQSIYSFQGADPAEFLKARQNLVVRAPGQVDEPQLSVSFRSAPTILSVVDAVFAPEDDAPRLTPDPSDVPRHMAARDDSPGLVEVWPVAPQPDKPEEPEDWTDPPDTAPPDTPRMRLARAIAARIRSDLAGGAAVMGKGEAGRAPRPLRPGDVMILVRRRGPLFEAMIRALKEADVPVAGADRMTLRDELAVEDVLGAARVALAPHDDLALAELLTSPLAHPAGMADAPLDDARLYRLAYGRGRARLLDRLMADVDPALDDARQLVRDVAAHAASARPFAFVTGLLGARSASGETYQARLRARLGPPADDPLRVLINRAQAYEARTAPSLLGFVYALLADPTQVKREMSDTLDEVRVMTIYGAKGLEAPVVFLPDAADPVRDNRSARPLVGANGAWLWSRSTALDTEEAAQAREIGARANLAEDARLLYVGMTRAEDRLVICGAAGGNKTRQTTWHDRVSAAMERLGAAPLDDAATLERLGAEEPGWRLGEGSARLAPQTQRSEPARTAPPSWMGRAAPSARHVGRMTAPSRADGASVSDGPARSPLADLDGARFARGLAIHRLLEILPELAPYEREQAGARYLAERTSLSDAAATAALAETLQVLNDPAFGSVFGANARAEAPLVGVAPDLQADAHGQPIVVSGRIDRLVITPDEVLAVDFKTNRPPPATPDAVAARTVRQMAAYRSVLRALYPGRVVRCALLWTDGPRLMPLPDSLLDGAAPNA